MHACTSKVWQTHCHLTHTQNFYIRTGICYNTWVTSWENLFMSYATNKDADQPAHPRSLISTFVVHCLHSIIAILEESKISRLKLVSVTEQTGLNLIWSEATEDRFSHDEAQMYLKRILMSCFYVTFRGTNTSWTCSSCRESLCFITQKVSIIYKGWHPYYKTF